MLREKFPEFCSSPSPPIEGREQGGGAAFGDGVLPAFLQEQPFGGSDWGSGERTALGIHVSWSPFIPALPYTEHLHYPVFSLLCRGCLLFLVLQKT